MCMKCVFNVYKKHLRKKKSLICSSAFCAFAWLCFYAFSAISACTFFCKKNKEFKRSQETSFCVIKTI